MEHRQMPSFHLKVHEKAEENKQTGELNHRSMASFEILPNDRDSSGSFPSGEYSLLHEVKKEPCLNADSNNINFDFTNMQSTMNKPVSDENSIFSKLFSNNLSMKESLNETNSRLKKLLDNSPGLASVIKQQQLSLKAFEEKISFLERENANLRCKLDFLVDGMSKVSPTELYPSIRTDEETGYEIVYIKASELDLLKKENEDLTETFKVNVLKIRELENELKAQIELMTAKLENESTVTEQHRKRCENLQQKYDEYVKTKSSEENDVKQELQNFQEILKKEREDHKVTREALVAAVLKLEKSEKEFDASSKRFEIRSRDEKAKLDLLEKENENLTETSKVHVLKIQELENASKAQLEQMTAELENKSTVAEQYKKSCESLQEKYDEYIKTKLLEEKEFEQELHNLQKSFKEERENHQDTRNELAAAVLRVEKSKRDFAEASRLLEIKVKDEEAKIVELQTAVASAEKRHLEKITNLTTRLSESQEQLSKNCTDNKAMLKKLSDVQNDNECIPILKALIVELQTAAASAEKRHLEKITNLTTRLSESEEQLSKNSTDNKALLKKLSDLQRDNECIPILITQIEKLQAANASTEKALLEKNNHLSAQLSSFQNKLRTYEADMQYLLEEGKEKDQRYEESLLEQDNLLAEVETLKNKLQESEEAKVSVPTVQPTTISFRLYSKKI